MYPASQALIDLFKGENPQTVQITLTPTTGSAITITEADIVQGTFYVNRACTASESLELGSVIAAECGMTLFNDGGKFDNVEFEGAEMFVRVGIGTTYIPMGYFTIDDIPKVRNTISIVGLDRMMFLDADVKDTTIKGANRTITQYVNRICTVCGLALATNISSYPNATYAVPKFPEEPVTYRQLLSWCCQIMGKNAYIDWDGNLRIEFPNNTVVDSYDETMRFSSDVEDYEVTTTGVVFNDGETETVVGTTDYAFDLSGNLLLQSTSVLQNLDIITTYKPFSATVVPCPWLFPMDRVNYVKDGADNIGIVTSVTFHLNGHSDIASVGESQKARSYARKDAVTTATRLVLERKVAELNAEIDNAMHEAVLQATQLITSTSGGYVVLHDKDNDGHVDEILIMDTEDISTAQKVWRWNENGLGYSSTGYNGTYGLAMTANGQIVADFITTGHMSADHIQGGTLTIGGASDANGVITVKDANGKVVGTMNKNGITTSSANITGGTININASASSENAIALYYASNYTKVSPLGVALKSNGQLANYIRIYDANDNQVALLGSGTSSGTLSGFNSLFRLGNASDDDLVDMYVATSPVTGVGSGQITVSNTSNNYFVTLNGESGSLGLSNGSTTIKIDYKCNVATLSYTVVSTF